MAEDVVQEMLWPPVEATLSTSDIREAHVCSIIALLRHHGDLTRAELGRASGLARPTVTVIVRRLIAEGLVVVSGQARDSTSPQGRPGDLLSFRSTTRTVASVRLEGHQVDVALGDVDGNVLAHRLAPRTPPSMSWTTLVTAIGEQVLDLHQANPDLGPLAAVALTLPGSVDRTRGLWTLPGRPGWRDLPVADRLSAVVGAPTTLLNTSAAALIGQLAHDPTHRDSAALIHIGAGIGCAMTSRGRLIDGATGDAGELGHCRIPGVTLRCWCGRTGCVETVTSPRFLRREFRRITGDRAPTSMAGMEASRDPRVRELITSAAHQLGLAASWLVNITNPSVVYLAGDAFMDGSTVFIEGLAGRLESTARRADARLTTVLPAGSCSTLAGTLQVACELLPQSLQPRLRLAL